MPNPIVVEVGPNAEYTFETHANRTQMVELRPRDKFNKPQVRTGRGDTLPSVHGLDAGVWELHHSSSSTGEAPWTKGRGRTRAGNVAEFDDHPTGGDNDFNDVQMVFFKGLIKFRSEDHREEHFSD